MVHWRVSCILLHTAKLFACWFHASPKEFSLTAHHFNYSQSNIVTSRQQDSHDYDNMAWVMRAKNPLWKSSGHLQLRPTTLKHSYVCDSTSLLLCTPLFWLLECVLCYPEQRQKQLRGLCWSWQTWNMRYFHISNCNAEERKDVRGNGVYDHWTIWGRGTCELRFWGGAHLATACRT